MPGGCLSAPPTVTIALDANHTTPYEWNYTMAPNGILEVSGYACTSDPNLSGETGVGGAETYEFTAVGEGRVTITVTHDYLFADSDQTPLSTVTYTYEVTTDGITEVR